MKRVIFFLSAVLIACFVFVENVSAQEGKLQNSLSGLEIPSGINAQIVSHYGFSLCYNEEFEIPWWVGYELTALELEGKVKRSDSFYVDPEIFEGSADNSDYKGSGYHRGHLAPAADFKWDERAMKDTFYFSNICPMTPSFNTGIWETLESKVRFWARKKGSLYITTGPVLRKKEFPLKIGANMVVVPERFFKVILFYQNGMAQAIGFVLENCASDKSISEIAVSVDLVEKETGLDFFYELPDDIERKVESQVTYSFWF